MPFSECISCEDSLQNIEGYIGPPSQNVISLKFFFNILKKVLSNANFYKPLFTIILGDFNARSLVKQTVEGKIEGTQFEFFTTFHGFRQLILCPTHLLPQSLSCIDMIFTGQAFINYNFSYMRFHARKTVLVACPCTWEIVLVKGQMCMLLILTCSSRKCTNLVLKPGIKLSDSGSQIVNHF